MPFYDRIQDSTQTQGTGSLTLDGTVYLGAQTLAAAATTGATTRLVTQNSTGQWEITEGTVTITSGVATFSRDTVLASSNGGALVNWGAGSKTVFSDIPSAFLNSLTTPLSVPFSFGDSSPVTLGSVLANKLVESVTIFITTAFDGAGASLTVGDVGNVARLMPSTANDPATAGGYGAHPGISYGGTTSLLLTITPGSGATTGAGLVLIKLQP